MTNVLHAFFRLAWPFMDYWITSTRSCKMIAPILWWQATRSEDARSAIVPIYRPTLTQMTTVGYPKIIDWVPHAALRDSLISQYANYDLDTMICDLTEAYIMEEDSADSASNVMDMVLGSLAVVDPLCGHSMTTATAFNQQQLFDFPATVSPTACTHSSPSGASRLHQFKIDPAFFAKYPHLYHPSAAGRRPVSRPVSFPRLCPPAPLTSHLMQAYLNLLLQNKA